MGILQDIGAWFKKVFTAIKVDIDKVAIVFTQEIKLGLESGVIDAIAKALDHVTGHLSVEIEDWLKKAIPKMLAVELAIQGLPDDATPEQVLAFENQVLAAVMSKEDYDKSKLWSTLSVQIYKLFDEALKANNGHLTFAQILVLIEQGYQDYLADKANEENL